MVKLPNHNIMIYIKQSIWKILKGLENSEQKKPQKPM